MDLVILLLVLTFPRWGASYYIDSSCDVFMTDIQSAFTEAQSMISRAQQSITTPAQGGTGWNGYTRSEKGATINDVLGTLFPKGLSDQQRTTISQAYGMLAAPGAMDNVWFVCEPIHPTPQRIPNGGFAMILTDISSPQGPQGRLVLGKDGVDPPPANPNQICASGAAACTLIGQPDKVIVLTQLALVQGLGSTADVAGAWTADENVLSLATWSDAAQSLSQVTAPVSMDAVICRSVLSHYLVHEAFHCLGTVSNLAAVVNDKPEYYGLNAVYKAASAENAQGTDYWIRNADSLAIYADAVFLASLTPSWTVYEGHLISPGFWNRLETRIASDTQAAWNNPDDQVAEGLPRDATFPTLYAAAWLNYYKDYVMSGQI